MAHAANVSHALFAFPLEDFCLILLRWPTSVNQNSEIASTDAHSRQTAAVAPEWNVLLAAALPAASQSHPDRLRSVLKAAQDRPFEWECLLRLADDHGVTSLLLQNLSCVDDLVPVPIFATLRQRYERNVHKSLFLARELIRVLDSLDALGIEAIPYKGVALSETYYGDLALRQPGDIDLFVRRNDVARIKTAVCALGFTPHVSIPESAEKNYIASGYEYSFDSSAGRGLLELQWALQPRFYAVDFDMEAVFERAVTVPVAGRTVKTPSPEDLLLILSIHAAKHEWVRLLWLCDIAQILTTADLNWTRIQHHAEKIGVQRILRITLLLANQLLQVPLPIPIEAAIHADRSAQTLAREIAQSMAAGVSHDVQQISYFRLMMRLRERRIDRLRFLSRLTFTPGPGEWQAVRLPRVLSPLYRVVRLARLASRLLKG
jgi:hypothetical protein